MGNFKMLIKTCNGHTFRSYCVKMSAPYLFLSSRKFFYRSAVVAVNSSLFLHAVDWLINHWFILYNYIKYKSWFCRSERYVSIWAVIIYLITPSQTPMHANCMYYRHHKILCAINII